MSLKSKYKALKGFLSDQLDLALKNNRDRHNSVNVEGGSYLSTFLKRRRRNLPEGGGVIPDLLFENGDVASRNGELRDLVGFKANSRTLISNLADSHDRLLDREISLESAKKKLEEASNEVAQKIAQTEVDGAQRSLEYARTKLLNDENRLRNSVEYSLDSARTRLRNVNAVNTLNHLTRSRTQFENLPNALMVGALAAGVASGVNTEIHKIDDHHRNLKGQRRNLKKKKKILEKKITKLEGALSKKAASRRALKKVDDFLESVVNTRVGAHIAGLDSETPKEMAEFVPKYLRNMGEALRDVVANTPEQASVKMRDFLRKNPVPEDYVRARGVDRPSNMVKLLQDFSLPTAVIGGGVLVSAGTLPLAVNRASDNIDKIKKLKGKIKEDKSEVESLTSRLGDLKKRKTAMDKKSSFSEKLVNAPRVLKHELMDYISRMSGARARKIEKQLQDLNKHIKEQAETVLETPLRPTSGRARLGMDENHAFRRAHLENRKNRLESLVHPLEQSLQKAKERSAATRYNTLKNTALAGSVLATWKLGSVAGSKALKKLKDKKDGFERKKKQG